MSNLGEQAMAILDELHTERLAYENEYVPLADAANLLTAYEETGMAPEEIKDMAELFHWMPLPKPPATPERKVEGVTMA